MSQSKSTEDDIRREILALADACVLCGQCLPVCPTYALDQREAESPRGRIVLIQRRAITSDSDSAVDSVALDHCLSCGRCEAICPATVKFARLMDLNRQLRRPRRSSSWMMRALLALVARPALLAWMVRVTAWPARWLPGRWMRLARVLQTPQIRKMPTRVQDSRPAVIVFAGCIERHAEQAALAALRRILHRLGWQVVDLPNQGCCGALARHAGDATAADRLRQSNQRALAAVLSDGSVRPGFVLTLSTGCHDEVRNALGESLPVMEAMAFLLAHTSLRTWRFRPLVDEVVLHSPCTSRPIPRQGNGRRKRFCVWSRN